MSIEIELSARSLIKPENKNFYDHEASPEQLQENHLTIKQKCLVVLTESLQIQCLPLKRIPKDLAQTAISEPLFQLHPFQNHFEVRPPSSREPSTFHQLVKSNESGVLLTNGNVIKIGKVQMRVRHLRREGQTAKRSEEGLEHYQSISTSFCSRSIYRREDTDAESLATNSFLEKLPCCRVCLSHSQHQTNKIVNCCSCKGSSQYIHEECLATWINSRIKIGSKELPTYSLKRKHCKCQLCLSYFDFDLLIRILFGQRVWTSYCVIEIDDFQEILTILNFTQKEDFLIGRGSSADLPLNDITVSRNHCILSYNKSDGGFYLTDYKSKFGTLVEWQQKKVMKEITLQIGRTIVTLEGHKKKGFLSKIFKFCTISENLSRERSSIRNR